MRITLQNPMTGPLITVTIEAKDIAVFGLAVPPTPDVIARFRALVNGAAPSVVGTTSGAVGGGAGVVRGAAASIAVGTSLIGVAGPAVLAEMLCSAGDSPAHPRSAPQNTLSPTHLRCMDAYNGSAECAQFRSQHGAPPAPTSTIDPKAARASAGMGDAVDRLQERIEAGGEDALRALEELKRLGLRAQFSGRVTNVLKLCHINRIETTIRRAAREKDLLELEQNVHALAELAASGNRTALDSLLSMSVQEDAGLYVTAAEQLARLALDDRLTPAEVEKIAADARPRLIPFLHFWAFRSPNAMPFRITPFVKMARESGMICADVIYILNALARVHHQLAERAISELLPHAGDQLNMLKRIADDHGLSVKTMRRRRYTTDLDVERGREAAWVRDVVEGKMKITTPGEVNRLARAANGGVPDALDALYRLAQGSGKLGNLAQALLRLMSVINGGPHQHTASLMLQELPKNPRP